MKFTTLVVLSVLLLGGCKFFGSNSVTPKIAKVEIKTRGVVLFLIGKATTDGKAIKRGDVISLDKSVKVESKGLVDLQIVDGETSVVIRLQQNSEFKLLNYKKGDVSELQGKLQLGSAIFNVTKLKKDVKFNITTPTMVAAVRGTQFKVAVKEDATSVNVTDGTIATHVNVPELDILSEAGASETSAVGKAQATIQASETIITAGQEVSVTQKEVNDVIKEAKVDAIVNDPAMQEIIKSGKEDKEQIKSLVDKVNKEDNTNFSEKEVSGTQQAINTALTPTKSKEDKAILDEISELNAIPISADNKEQEDAKLKKQVEDRLKKKSGELVNRVEATMGKKSETVILKSGRRLTGVIFQVHTDYVITTPEGEQIIPADSIEGFAF